VEAGWRSQGTLSDLGRLFNQRSKVCQLRVNQFSLLRSRALPSVRNSNESVVSLTFASWNPVISWLRQNRGAEAGNIGFRTFGSTHRLLNRCLRPLGALLFFLAQLRGSVTTMSPVERPGKDTRHLRCVSGAVRELCGARTARPTSRGRSQSGAKRVDMAS
jgi:hypothetical protein